MKIFTLIIALIHLFYIIGLMWLGPFLLYLTVTNKCSLVYLTIAWCVCIIVQILHWGTSVMSNECILSYLEKLSEDPKYVKGSDPDKTYAWILLSRFTGGVEIRKIRAFHLVMSKVAFLFAVALLTLNNRCLPKTVSETTKVVAYAVLTGLVSRFICLDSAYCAERPN